MQIETRKILTFLLEVPAELEHYKAIENLPKTYQAIAIFNNALGDGIKNDLKPMVESFKKSLKEKTTPDGESVIDPAEKFLNEAIAHIQKCYVDIFKVFEVIIK